MYLRSQKKRERERSNFQKGKSQGVPRLEADTNLRTQKANENACALADTHSIRACAHTYMSLTSPSIIKVQKTKDKKKI